LYQRGSFDLTFEFANPIGRNDLVKELEMVGNHTGRSLVGRRCQHNSAPSTLLLTQQGNEPHVVGNQVRCKFRKYSRLPLKSGGARRQQSGQIGKPLTAGENVQKALNEQIRLEKCAVEISANRLIDACLVAHPAAGRRTVVNAASRHLPPAANPAMAPADGIVHSETAVTDGHWQPNEDRPDFTYQFRERYDK
jgi:hypothetical protein